MHTWSNNSSRPPTQIPDAQLNFVVVCVMIVVDTFLYLILIWYIEGVYPGKYGVAKPFYFPFMPSYWLGQKGRGLWQRRGGAHHVRLNDMEGTELVDPSSAAQEDAVCEDDPEHLNRGIAIRNLSKVGLKLAAVCAHQPGAINALGLLRGCTIATVVSISVPTLSSSLLFSRTPQGGGVEGSL